MRYSAPIINGSGKTPLPEVGNPQRLLNDEVKLRDPTVGLPFSSPTDDDRHAAASYSRNNKLNASRGLSYGLTQQN